MTSTKTVSQPALTLIAKKPQQRKPHKKRAGHAATLPKTTLTIAWILVLITALPPRYFIQMVRTAGLAQGTITAPPSVPTILLVKGTVPHVVFIPKRHQTPAERAMFLVKPHK